MTKDALLAILRVPKVNRVRCQAPGCKRPVYQSIHVVRLNGAVTVYGSECFKIHFEGHPMGSAAPTYPSVSNKLLSDEERAMLDSNTEQLLAQLQQEHAENLARVEAQRIPRVRHAPRYDSQFDDDAPSAAETKDPVLRELILAREQGLSRSHMLAARGLKPGDAGFYDFSLLLAKAGFEF